ncbi:glycyl-tRNA synthetase beta chain [Terriglobus roseus DSM 18391]|uniref:Glycine--tRNA ligase beta subunit n=1 Tax=Terriglobus roseus (strain DSM 18391 / NRRL B-41598 / KBS 63) TaxID=926566 RepID=I3ZID3_TERRK|nr:glycine--tRNA ligase subunit beta [Terriglobus roseus]AFL89001.1 glycyl-tRNA synthetase beta chain [Terriglobus roseus DSM 18391]
MADFLFEIGLEEVPARMLPGAQAELAKRVTDLLTRERLVAEGSTTESYSSPRRIAVVVNGVLAGQADVEEELLGPPVKAAYKDGKPTKAAEAFAEKAGVAVDALRTITNAKGEYLAATAKRAGRSFAEVITAELPKEIAGLYWAKNMRWRPGQPERFVRPIQWMLALLDAAVIPVEWAGTTAGAVTYGHRVLYGYAPITIASPVEYAHKLYEAKVMVNVEHRRERIRKALDKVMRQVEGARWREDHPLVDKVTHLTEWPSIILGGFEAEFLPLPQEVLVTVMRDHQNYFAVEDAAGKLAPYFLAVLNTEPSEKATEIIRHGNERVLRARFNDARFFYEFDQRMPLAERVALLENVTFQKELGSYAAKSERVRAVAAKLGITAKEHWLTKPATKSVGNQLDLEALDTAARLSKTDLTTELVKEFTELQGVVGGLYAKAQGHSTVVADAIYAHYQPVGMDDAIPSTNEGLLLAIADKVDTISGMFGLGLQPTGSKDPFALRRAANGIVKMLAESTLPLTLGEVATAATGADEALCGNVKAFLVERLEWYLREVRGTAYDVVKAVMAANPDDVRDAIARVDAVSAARSSEDFAAIAAAFKRMKNLVDQAKAKGEVFTPSAHREFLTEPVERTLAEESGRRAAWVEGLRKDGDYKLALATIAELRPFVDQFFEKVMVMAPEPSLRAARLGLLQRILMDYGKVADFSEIVIAG